MPRVGERHFRIPNPHTLIHRQKPLCVDPVAFLSLRIDRYGISDIRQGLSHSFETIAFGDCHGCTQRGAGASIASYVALCHIYFTATSPGLPI